jgi:hypothetical protein
MESLDRDVRRALRAAGVPDASVLADVVRAWPLAVGPAVSRAAWPQRISRDGTLHVTTVSSIWAFELGRLEREIHEKLAGSLGAATPPALRFAPGPVPEPPAIERREVAPPIPPTAAETARSQELVADISDPELRESVRRAAAASLAAHRDDRGL